MTIERSVTINASPEQVFAYVADITKHPEWAQPAHKLQIEQTSEGPIGQGSTFKSVGHQFGRNEDTVTITEYVPNQRVVYEASGNAGLLRHAFEVAPVDGGVRLTKSVDIVQAKFPFALFAPMAKMFIIPGGLDGDLQRIKQRIEEG